MRVLAYEGRRLLGLRSSRLILAGALLADAAVAALLSRRAAPGPLPVSDAVRLVTATVPLLPIPLAALAAGVLGALASAHEVRHPGLVASQVRYRARLRLLLGKLAVVGAVSAVLATLSLLVDALTVRLALPSATSAARLFAPELLRSDHRPVLVLATFAGLVIAAGWTGVLAAALTRSAAAGILLLCALPTLVEALVVPPVVELLRHSGSTWVLRAGVADPFPFGLDRLYSGSTPSGAVAKATGSLGSLSSPFEATPPLAVAALLIPALLLFAGCLLAQARRRSF